MDLMCSLKKKTCLECLLKDAYMMKTYPGYDGLVRVVDFSSVQSIWCHLKLQDSNFCLWANGSGRSLVVHREERATVESVGGQDVILWSLLT